MAGTNYVQLSIRNSNGLATHTYDYPQKQLTQTNQGVFDRIINVTTTEATVAFTGITTPGLVVLQNLNTSTTTTDFVSFGNNTGSYIGKLPPDGAPAVMTWVSGETLYLDANNSTCNVRLIVHEA